MSFRSYIKRVVYGNYALYVASHQLVHFFMRHAGGGVKVVNRGCAKLCKDVVGGNNSVFIGDNCILASKSLLTKSVTESCLVAGLPAKVVKTGVNWTREALY